MRIDNRDPGTCAALVRQGLADRHDATAGRLVGGENQYGGARSAKEIAGTPQSRSNSNAVADALRVGPWQPGGSPPSDLSTCCVRPGCGSRREARPSSTDRSRTICRWRRSAPKPQWPLNLPDCRSRPAFATGRSALGLAAGRQRCPTCGARQRSTDPRDFSPDANVRCVTSTDHADVE